MLPQPLSGRKDGRKRACENDILHAVASAAPLGPVHAGRPLDLNLARPESIININQIAHRPSGSVCPGRRRCRRWCVAEARSVPIDTGIAPGRERREMRISQIPRERRHMRNGIMSCLCLLAIVCPARSPSLSYA